MNNWSFGDRRDLENNIVQDRQITKVVRSNQKDDWLERQLTKIHRVGYEKDDFIKVHWAGKEA